MYLLSFYRPCILPTLLSIVLLCVRPKSRKLVPLLSVILNFALYDLMARQILGETPVFRIPFKLQMYQYVCVTALFIGLLVEIIIRATVRWGKNKMRNTDAPPISGGILMADLLTLCVVLSSFIGFIAPQTLGSLVLVGSVFLAALQLKGSKPRWVLVIFWTYGYYLIAGICLSLTYTQSFQSFAGFQLSFEMVKRLVAWQCWFSLLANLVFGVALYSLCKKFKAQLMALEGPTMPSINSADGSSALPGDRLAEPPRLCADKAPTLIDIDVNSQS